MTSDQVQAGSHILGIVGVIYRYSDPWIVVESTGDLTTALRGESCQVGAAPGCPLCPTFCRSGYDGQMSLIEAVIHKPPVFLNWSILVKT
jgi:hypothetical protein